MSKKLEEENRMDRILKELGDLYEFNRKIKEYKFVQKDKKTQSVDEASTLEDAYRKRGEGSE